MVMEKRRFWLERMNRWKIEEMVNIICTVSWGQYKYGWRVAAQCLCACCVCPCEHNLNHNMNWFYVYACKYPTFAHDYAIDIDLRMVYHSPCAPLVSPFKVILIDLNEICLAYSWSDFNIIFRHRFSFAQNIWPNSYEIIKRKNGYTKRKSKKKNNEPFQPQCNRTSFQQQPEKKMSLFKHWQFNVYLQKQPTTQSNCILFFYRFHTVKVLNKYTMSTAERNIIFIYQINK